jgi:predicted glycosyltransferase
MAGYNPFCESLSFDKRAILVPRVRPRREQVLRAQRAAALDLAHALDPQDRHRPAVMTDALRRLADRPTPSQRRSAAMLNGLETITDLVAAHVGRADTPRPRAVAASV